MERNDELTRRIDAWFEEHREEFFEAIDRLVAINSVRTAEEGDKPYGPGPYKALMAAKDMLESYGIPVVNFENRVISGDIGTGDARLGILAHLDTVGVGDGWDTYPFEATYKDGVIYGRGVSDDKGPAVAAIFAVRCAKELGLTLSGVCRIILGSAEETGCQDIALYMEKNAMPQYVFSPDADFPVINIEKGRTVAEFCGEWGCDGERRIVKFTGGTTANIVPNFAEAVVTGVKLEETAGLCAVYSTVTGAEITALEEDGNVRIQTVGRAAHASAASEGINAQTALIAVLDALKLSGKYGETVASLKALFPHGDTGGNAFGIAAKDDISSELTLNFGVFSGDENGFAGNFDSRTPVKTDYTDLEAAINAKFASAGITVKYIDRVKSHVTPSDSPLVRKLLDVYELYTGEKGEPLAIGGSSYVHEIDGGVAFGCVFPGKNTLMHGANEHIDAEDLLISAKMFAHAIKKICE